MIQIRRSLLLSVLTSLILCTSLWATPRKEQDARMIAEQFIRMLPTKYHTLNGGYASPVGSLSLVSAPARGATHEYEVRSKGAYPAMPDEYAYFVYNIGSNDGFVMISGDDLLPDVIGFATEGSFASEEDMPRDIASFYEGLRTTLDLLVRQNKKIATPSLRTLRPEGVEPLLHRIEWDQGAPWWDQCPDKDGRCYVGCVATAMAQIMRYHRWPDRGHGTYSYVEEDGYSHQVDYGATEYHWDDMPEQVPSPELITPAQREALATISYHAGVSVKMSYSSEGSGTFSALVVRALIENFRYDKNAQLLNRVHYTAEQWIEFVSEELNARRPVFFSGVSSSGGHAFVCDGYRGDGFFHFNFGWAGMSNHYYLLHVISPDALGMGGGTAHDGYNASQSMIRHITPDRTDSSVRTIPEEVESYTFMAQAQGSIIESSLNLVNLVGNATFTTRFYLTARPINSDRTYYSAPSQMITLETPKIVEITGLSMDLGSLGLSTTNTSYVVSLAYEWNGQKLPVKHMRGFYSEQIVSYDAHGTPTIQEQSLKPDLTLVSVGDVQLAGYDEGHLTVTLRNNADDEFNDKIDCFFVTNNGTRKLAASFMPLIRAHQTETTDLPIDILPFPEGTEGHFEFTTYYNNEYLTPQKMTMISDDPYRVGPSITGHGYILASWPLADAKKAVRQTPVVDRYGKITVMLQNIGQKPLQSYACFVSVDGYTKRTPDIENFLPDETIFFDIKLMNFFLISERSYTLKLQPVSYKENAKGQWVVDKIYETVSYTFKVTGKPTHTDDDPVPVYYIQPAHGTLALTQSTGNAISSGETLPIGTTVMATATPHHGYELASLIANDVDIKDSRQFVLGDETVVVASFKKIDYTISYTQPAVGGHFVVKVADREISSGEKLPYGSEATVVVSTEAGYAVDKVLVNGREIPVPYKFVLEDNSTIEVTLRDITSVEEMTAGVVSIYPNPIDSYLIIKAPADLIGQTALLSDMQGHPVAEIVLMGSETRFDMRGLPEGQYLLHIAGESHLLMKR